MSKPRVLAVTSELPWPLNSGGHIRSFHMLSALAAATDLRVVCPIRPQEREAAESLRARGIKLIPVPVPSRTKLGEARRLLGAFFRGEPYVMYRRHAWKPVAAAWKAANLAAPADVWCLDHIDSLMYHTSRKPSLPAVIDLHNVYSLLVRRMAEEQSDPLKRKFLKREASLLDKMERRAANSGSTLFAVSEQEANHFRSLGAKSVHVIPNGVDCAAFADLPTGRPASPPVILFLGTMSWGPNAAAAKFLAETILPQLRERVPEARVVIVGRDPPPELKALHGKPGVEVTGSVPDVKPYFANSTLLAVPLDAGGGTRLKILEAFAAGLPVVSTAIGAEGINATPGVHFISAERPEFAEAIADVLAVPDAAAQMAAAARRLANEVYDWGTIGKKAVELITNLKSPGTAVPGL